MSEETGAVGTSATAGVIGHGEFGELWVVERIGTEGRPEWELTQPITYVTPGGDSYTAPAGMRTNFASVPFFLTWAVSRSGRHNKAAVIHDLLWRRANDGQLDRRVADEVFRDALGQLGMSWLRRWMMWTGVRQAGFFGRNRGSWPIRDFAIVFLITALVAPIVIPTSIVGLAGRLLLWAIDLVPSLIRGRRVPVLDEI